MGRATSVRSAARLHASHAVAHPPAAFHLCSSLSPLSVVHCVGRSLGYESTLRDHFTLPAEAAYSRSLPLLPNTNDSLPAARPSSPSGTAPMACEQGKGTIHGSAQSVRDNLTSHAEAVYGRSLPAPNVENSSSLLPSASPPRSHGHHQHYKGDSSLQLCKAHQWYVILSRLSPR